MGMSESSINVWTLSLVRKRFVSVDGEWIQTYVTDEPESFNDHSIGQVLRELHIELKRVLSKMYEGCEKVEWG